MKYFKDIETGTHWAFGDEIVTKPVEGGIELFDPLGGKIQDIPTTLEPVEKLPEPKPPVPQSVSRFQGREAMWQTPHRGVTLFEAVEAAITDPSMPAKYKRAWDDLQEFHRDSEMLIAIAGLLELSDEYLDDLFILAASIKA